MTPRKPAPDWPKPVAWHTTQEVPQVEDDRMGRADAERIWRLNTVEYRAP